MIARFIELTVNLWRTVRYYLQPILRRANRLIKQRDCWTEIPRLIALSSFRRHIGISIDFNLFNLLLSVI